MASDVPVIGLNAPLKIHHLALEIFVPFPIPYLAIFADLRMCPTEKWPCLKIV